MKQTKSKRLRSYAGTVVVLAVVFGGSAVIGAHVRSEKEHTAKAPTGAAGQDSLAVPVRPDVLPVTLTVYEDLRAPESKAFAAEYADTFTQLLAAGQVQIDYRLVTPSDAANGGEGALAAANAAACAQDQGHFTQFVDALWAVQPVDVADDGLNSEKLLKSVSRQAHGIDEAKFVPCVEERDHDGWVKKSQRQFTEAGFTAAPVVQVNGETVTAPTGGADGLTPARLRALVQKAVDLAVRQAVSPSPSSSASATDGSTTAGTGTPSDTATSGTDTAGTGADPSATTSESVTPVG
ncbi:thioredoxin domain-containing protein [Streptomyces sp. NPDC046977]|uniref:DsbA family protein n=1 Tax=Streptomyces sp. NPDC046977 TaxID=3154703 RepID=UPI00340A36D1